MADFNLPDLFDIETALYLLGGNSTNTYCKSCNKYLAKHSSLLRHIKSKHLGIPRMSTKKRSLEQANQEIISLKRNRFNEETVIQVLKRDHIESRFSCINAVAEVF